MQPFDSKVDIGFIGAGLVATCLAIALSRKGYQVKAVASKSLTSAQSLASQIEACTPYSTAQEVVDRSKVVFITAPDDAIKSIASAFSWRKGQGAVHCSGVLALDEMEQARRSGTVVGAFHPLQTFSSVEDAINSLPGATFAIEAEQPLRAFLEEAALALGGRHISLNPGDRLLYHTSAVMTSGFTVTLLKLATDLWEKLGFSRHEALTAMLPLLKGTVKGLESVGIPNALTGPLARGDIGIIEKHIEELERRAPEVLPAYCQLALAQIPIAIDKGSLRTSAAKRIQTLLEARL